MDVLKNICLNYLWERQKDRDAHPFQGKHTKRGCKRTSINIYWIFIRLELTCHIVICQGANQSIINYDINDQNTKYVSNTLACIHSSISPFTTIGTPQEQFNSQKLYYRPLIDTLCLHKRCLKQHLCRYYITLFNNGVIFHCHKWTALNYREEGELAFLYGKEDQKICGCPSFQHCTNTH